MKSTFLCKIIKDNVWLMIDNQMQIAKIKGSIWKQHKLMVGDVVEYEIKDGLYLITNIKKRKNELIRPKVANIDIILIIQSVIEPEFNTLLLEKMILFYLMNNIKKIYVGISKLDLIYNSPKYFQILKLIKKYNDIGLCFYDLNDDNEYHKLLSLFKNQIVCLVGNSGVGKSTFINKIAPQLKLQTQTISKSLNRGKHTTTYTSINYVNDFYLVDTPGFSTINISHINISLLKDFYFGFFLKDHKCKYLDCIHIHENDCYIKSKLKNNDLLLWRYENYLLIYNTIFKK